MEEFVNFMQSNKNEKKEINLNRMQNTKFRELISKIIDFNPEVEIVDKVNQEGDVKFFIKMKDIGIDFDSFINYKNEIFSDFIANFLGELIIRENINKFANLLTNIDVENYISTVNDYEHRQFGMEVYNRKFAFSFHVSLLQSILVKNFFTKALKKS